MVTRSTSFGPTASVADTKTPIGSAYTFATSGRIAKIRVNGYQGVTDKAQNGILILDFKRLAGPFEFAVMAANTEVTVGGSHPTEEIDVDIPYSNGEVITVSLTTAEALEECTVSITMVE
jgi:hypothetical protein